jgi:hypothetical protein
MENTASAISIVLLASGQFYVTPAMYLMMAMMLLTAPYPATSCVSCA